MDDKREEQLKLLREVHNFPTRFLFKAIGPNSADFLAQVLQTVVTLCGQHNNAQTEAKESSGGKYLAVTVFVDIDSAETVLEVYAALRQITGLLHLM